MRAHWRLLAFPLAVASLAPSARADDLTVYRCVDAKGKLTLRDSPCPRGEQQQTRAMIRPHDAAPTRIPPRPSAPPPAPGETLRYITVAAPRTLYECAAPDGRHYMSESPLGQPRWQPLWAAVPMAPGYPPVRIAEGNARLSYHDRHTSVEIAGGSRLIGAPVYRAHVYPVPVGGTWVHDECVPLSSAEICTRLADRQSEIRRRYVHSMPSERAMMDRESATLDARLATECSR